MKIFLFAFMILFGSAMADDSTHIAGLFSKAESGDMEAQYELGYCYSHGVGVKQDGLKAYNLLRCPADNGHAKAQYELAVLLDIYDNARFWNLRNQVYEQTIDSIENEFRISEDSKELIQSNLMRDLDPSKWYHKAAEQGLAEAQCALGFNYYYGYIGDTRESEKNAVIWLEKAALQNDMYAQSMLGFILSTRGEMAAAYFWTVLAMEHGDKNIMDNYDKIKTAMTEKQIQEAQKLLDEWHKEHSK